VKGSRVMTIARSGPISTIPTRGRGAISNPCGIFVSMTYEQQLLTPHWRVRRNEILERDDYCCQDCLRGKREQRIELHVHHKSYVDGWMAWEYPNSYLITLCEECHQKIHGLIPDHRTERQKPAFVYGIRDFKSHDTKTIYQIMVDFLNSLKDGR